MWGANLKKRFGVDAVDGFVELHKRDLIAIPSLCGEVRREGNGHSAKWRPRGSSVWRP